MAASAALCFVFFYTGRRLARWDGIVFLTASVVYLGVLFHRAGGA